MTTSDTPLAVVPASDALAITDQRAGWSQTHTYTVVSMDAALNESSRSASASISIPEAPVGQEFKLTVKVNGYSAQATVESLADYLSYPLSDNGNSQNPQYVAFLNANQKKTFSGLPYGMYRVRVRSTGRPAFPRASGSSSGTSSCMRTAHSSSR